MKARTTAKMCASTRPKVSELRKRFEFIKASFAVEDIYFSEEELRLIEHSIKSRHRHRGFSATVQKLLSSAKQG